MEEKEYSVSEAVRLVGVESHVLRYWEEELRIEIRRSVQGHRIYSEENIELFRRVRELKEKGLQLKAIRLLLDSQGSLEFEELTDDEGFAKQIRGLAEGQEVLCGEIVPVEKPEPTRQLERILRHMMEEVVAEQNEKLEESIAVRIREELEEFYLQYERTAREAAATMETENSRPGALRRALGRLLRKNR